MGLSSIGIPSLILIVIIALIIFGPQKLPEIGSALGKTFNEFKSTTDELLNDDKDKSDD